MTWVVGVMDDTLTLWDRGGSGRAVSKQATGTLAWRVKQYPKAFITVRSTSKIQECG